MALFDGAGFSATVALVANISDPDGDQLSVLWTWAGGSATGASSAAILVPGVYTIAATVSDPSGADATDSVSIIVWIPSN